MVKLLSFLSLLVASTIGIPLQESGDSVLQVMNLTDVSNLFMSPTISHGLDQSLKDSLQLKSLHSSHLIEASKDSAVGAVIIPFETGVESAAIGGQVSAAAALKGTAKGSAIATPIILKAVALPGLAAGATATVMSFPNWIAQNVKHNSNLLFQNVKTSLEDSTHDFANLLIIEDSHFEDDLTVNTLDLNQTKEHVVQKLETLKTGALGLATKGLVAAKKGVRVVGRLIFKPIAIVTGLHLKALGTGLTLGGKLLAGTGAGVAKVGTAVKYTGLGSIGLGASAIGWGFDKTTIDTHFQESKQKFRLETQF